MSYSEKLIRRHEGRALRPYRDTEGVLTIGYGHNLDDGISEEIANFIFSEDMQSVRNNCKKFDWYEDLGNVRQAVIENMVFNLGFYRFSLFKKTIHAIENEDWHTAAAEMINSKWAKQVGYRAEELSEMMYTGVIT